uniref:Uncharacterized protein n=1 Tax=Arundo donax TaxID=35708 RepID=A0A0A9FJ23_ARUDO
MFVLVQLNTRRVRERDRTLMFVRGENSMSQDYLKFI